VTRKIMPGAEPFYWEGNDIGCLLVHGFTGTPKEMLWMGEYLRDKGYTVLGVRLAGHGTSMADMEKTTWQDWFGSVKEGYERLRAQNKQIFALGLSMGGALVLHLAAHRPLAGVVAMSTPLRLNNPFVPLLPVIRYFMPRMPKGEGTWVDPSIEAWHIAYSHYPSVSIMQLVKFLNHYRDDLAEISIPTLLMQSKTDNLVLPNNMEMLRALLVHAPLETFWVEQSDHLLTEDAERTKVFQKAEAFIRANATL